MKKRIMGMAVAVAAIFCIASPVFAKSSVWQETKKVSFKGGSRQVSAVYVDMNDKTIRMEAAAAKNQVGQVDDLKNIAAQAGRDDAQVLAAINGTFFDAYATGVQQPWSALQSRGQFLHMGTAGSVIGFTADNKSQVESLYVSIDGSINGSWEYPNNWYAWGFNHAYDDAGAIAVFTPDYGKVTYKHSRTSIVVTNGIVSAIQTGQASIPANGFVIITGDSKMVQRFKKGDAVAYKLSYCKSDFTKANRKGQAIQWEHIRTTIGAGPALVKNGVILADASKEGFTEDKITKNRGQRSFVGVTKSNILIMGTVSDVTVKELGEIVKNLGVTDGINLDGGASSGLYYGGKYVTAPGRKLSNALVVTKLKEQPLRFKINNTDAFFTKDPYVSPQGVVMVPAEAVARFMGGTFQRNSTARTFQLRRGNIVIDCKLDSAAARTGGKDRTMRSNAVMRYGVEYIPADILTTVFGGTLKLSTNKKLAEMQMDLLRVPEFYAQAAAYEKQNKPEQALALYEKILGLDADHIDSRLRAARLYAGKKDYAKAISHYLHYLQLRPEDMDVWSSLGWAYYGNNEMQKAVDAFQKVLGKKPDSCSTWIALAYAYASNALQANDKALECLDKAEKLKPTADQKKQIASLRDSILLKTWLNQAIASAKQKDYPAAITYYTKYLQKNPDQQPWVWGSLAWAYYCNGEAAKAIEAFEQQRKRVPGDCQILINMAEVYAGTQLKQYEKALACLEQAETLKPTLEQQEKIRQRREAIHLLIER